MWNRPRRREVRDDDKNLGVSNIQMAPKAQHSDKERLGPGMTIPGLEASIGHAMSGQAEILTQSKPTSRQALRCSITFKVQAAQTHLILVITTEEREHIYIGTRSSILYRLISQRKKQILIWGLSSRSKCPMQAGDEQETKHSFRTFFSKRSWLWTTFHPEVTQRLRSLFKFSNIHSDIFVVG